MLIILAAYRIAVLKTLIRPEATKLGQHLGGLLKRWITIPGNDLSPSIQQAIHLIEVADKLIKNEAGGD